MKARLTDPARGTPKTYRAQVELPPGTTGVDEAALDPLREGMTLPDGPTRPAKVRLLDAGETAAQEAEPPSRPPVRPRAGCATAWLELTITEGRNRQVRRMLAAVGLPTLRLVRTGVGPWTLDGMKPGQVRKVEGIPAELFRRSPTARA